LISAAAAKFWASSACFSRLFIQLGSAPAKEALTLAARCWTAERRLVWSGPPLEAGPNAAAPFVMRRSNSMVVISPGSGTTLVYNVRKREPLVRDDVKIAKERKHLDQR